MNNLETRVKYLEAVCSLSAQEWGDYGWIATCNTLEEIDAVIKKRIDRVLNIDKIEQAMERIQNNPLLMQKEGLVDPNDGATPPKDGKKPPVKPDDE